MTDISAYDYELPSELIAQQPLTHRAQARLLVVDRAGQTLHHRRVEHLPELLQPGDCLVINDTRVLPARLIGKRTETGGRWEGLFLHRCESGLWKILSRTRGKLKPGESVTLVDAAGREYARLEFVERLEQGMWLVRPEREEGLLEQVGRVPLPPYIRGGQEEPGDRESYQTVYAAKPGSVAAPTAGLHLTDPLLAQLEHRGIPVIRVTLHVGLGTFRPVSAERLEEHRMHSEWGEISAEAAAAIQAARASGGRVIAVGTTCARLLETAMRGGECAGWSGWTDLFIRPPYAFCALNGLLTNFHLPRSTLLVLVRTFGGDELIKRAYEEAIREKYRFYSYGDAMLVL